MLAHYETPQGLVDSGPLEKIKTVDRIAQFKSTIPCQKELVEEAQERCMVWMVLTLGLMFILQLLTISLAIMVWIFLSNRCADHVEATIQFQVDLDDLSGSEDDFDVTADEASD